MGVLRVILMSVFCLFVTVLSVHGSTGPAISPHSNPHRSGWHRHGGHVFSLPGPMANSPTRALFPDISKKAYTKALPPYISPSRSSAINWGQGSVLHGYGLPPSLSPSPSPFSALAGDSWPTLAPSPTQSGQYNMPIFSPMISPMASPSKKGIKSPPPSEAMALPPPPPNEDCTSVTCAEPFTYTVPGTPCGCVMPIQVKMQLSVTLYTFFPLVSELAREIAASVSFNQSQVRIMGADASSQELKKTIVLTNLIPLGARFNFSTAYLIYKKFWDKQVFVKNSLFGPYEVLYVHYPGLPPSPPTAPSNIDIIDDGSNPGNDNHGRTIKPLGVNIPRRRKDSLNKSLIAVIALSSFTAFVICMAVILILILKCHFCVHHPVQSSLAKPIGAAGSIAIGSRESSETMSIGSSMLTYTGSAKTFSLSDMERATNNFDESRILGEGGFGLVYGGALDDGTKVAVKVLKRDDQEGGREFLAEVEMLSRLHHRNLVKLIGICAEDHTRCLVYELISNGSVESRLHGIDKERDPLDWGSRMKIALGAARGLAYLHEDSSPRVIHRDFKSSNILLEDDFTPKVSDFGLARTAMEEGNKHISTHVMGTFGYLAPEYAMTGHLLVKSDVYSYGVVLLELLTGRKPVDLSQPPGQENLVLWARPLLTSREGLEAIMDPNLHSYGYIPFDTVAKVAAIASMCVQPEVSHRPFMGEVVQALKLVCYEFDETKEQQRSRTCSQEEFCLDIDSKIRDSSELVEDSPAHYQIPVYDANFDNKISLSTSDLVGTSGYDANFDSKIAMSTSDLVSTSAAFEGKDSGSFRRYSNSGPLVIGKKRQFWHRLRRLSKEGSTSERDTNKNLKDFEQ